MKPDQISAWGLLARIAPIRTFVNRGLHRAASRRMREVGRSDVAETQVQVLLDLVHKAARTPFGADHQFDRIRSLAEYRQRVPLRSHREFWERYWKNGDLMAGGSTWPGKIRYWLERESPTGGTAQRIPLSDEMIASRGKASSTLLASYLSSHHESRLLQGRMLALRDPSVKSMGTKAGGEVGWADALAASSPLGKGLSSYFLAKPARNSSLNAEQQQEQEVEWSLRAPISLLVGDGPPLVSFIERVLAKTGKSTLKEVWPALEFVIREGTECHSDSVGLRTLLGSRSIRLMESYSCEEGMIGFTSSGHDQYRFHFDHGIFYEFIPVDELENSNPARHWLANVKTDTEYAIAVSTCSGLWGYLLDTTIRFSSLTPPLFVPVGRRPLPRGTEIPPLTHAEVETALADTTKMTSSVVKERRLGFVAGESSSHYEFVLEFLTPPRDLALFRRLLDDELARQSDSYQKMRGKDGVLSAPTVAVASAGGLDAWSNSTGGSEGDVSLDVTKRLIDYLRGHRLLAAFDQDTVSRC